MDGVSMVAEGAVRIVDNSKGNTGTGSQI